MMCVTNTHHIYSYLKSSAHCLGLIASATNIHMAMMSPRWVNEKLPKSYIFHVELNIYAADIIHVDGSVDYDSSNLFCNPYNSQMHPIIVLLCSSTGKKNTVQQQVQGQIKHAIGYMLCKKSQSQPLWWYCAMMTSWHGGILEGGFTNRDIKYN